MMKTVFVSLGLYPCPQGRTATEVRAWQNLIALRELGFAITIVTTPDPAGREIPGFPVVLAPPLPETHFVQFHRHCRYRRTVKNLIAHHLPDLSTILFCEHWAALACIPRHPRVVYSCHDLERNLGRLRRLLKQKPAITLKMRTYWWLTNYLENRLFKKIDRAICVSASEAQCVKARWRIPAEYIPTVPPATAGEPAKGLNPSIRYWIYGGSGATSNKIILDHLARELYDLLKAAAPRAEFHQAGNFNTYAPERIEWLRRHFTVHGFMDDPARIFQRGDFCLIPYQYDTGFRTKIPEVCGYGMICAGYPATFACCPEMRDGYNCIIAETPAALAEKLALVASDDVTRERLSASAIETRRRDFSPVVLLEKYRSALVF